MPSVMWGTAMVAFVAAGLGLIGVRPLGRYAPLLANVAAATSVMAFLFRPDADLLVGIGLDGVAVVVANGIDVPERRRGVIGHVIAYGFLAFITTAAVTHRFHRSWGTTPEDFTRALPGDAPDRNPTYETTHAITINAPIEKVWPWLAQIGQDRGGFYSYDWLENVFLLDIHNANAVRPEWGDRKVGDVVRAAPRGWLGIDDAGWRVAHVEPGRALTLQYWGTFALVPLDATHTRLIVRSKMADPKYPVFAAAISFVLLDLEHFIMERKMLLGIKARAEAS